MTHSHMQILKEIKNTVLGNAYCHLYRCTYICRIKMKKNTVLGNAYCCLSLGTDVLTC